jgi:hypothetical protein
MFFVAYDDGFATVVDVSGFTIKSHTNAVTSAANYLIWVIGNGIAKFRIHHMACKPQNLGDNGSERCVTDYSDDAGLSYHSGLVDHVYCSVPTNGGVCFNSRTSTNAGAPMWKHTLELGTNKSTYFEDNECYFPSADADGCYDMYDGASYVWRYNTNTRGGQGNHGADSSAYGQFVTEIYRNTNTNPGSHQVSPSDPGRGSFQIMFDETSFGLYDWLSNIRIYRSEATNPADIYTGDGVDTTFPISFSFPNGPQVGVTETVIATGVRTRKVYTTDYSVVGTDVVAVTAPPATVTWTLHRAAMGKPGFPCDFETTWDLNLGTAGQSNLGYPCLHQVGWAWPAPAGCTNEATCGVANGANAVYNPTYMWGNTIEGVKTGTFGTYQSAGYPAGYVHINSATSPSLIDLYTDTDGVACTPGGSCTVGVGIGTTLPTTCTTASGPNGGVGGVGFWKTDEGSWNQSGDGRGSGILYKCTATDTWTVYYTPYTYPHPLQGAEAGADQAPTHVVVARVLRWMEILLPIVGLGFQFRRAVATSVGVVLACSMTAGMTTLSMTKRVTTVAAVKVLTVFNDSLKPRG